MIKIKLLLLSAILLLIVGCSGKKNNETASIDTCASTKEVNCTELNKSKANGTVTIQGPPSILKSIKNTTYSVLVDRDHFIIKKVKQPIVLINFFSTWCPPCSGQIPYFEDLQKKYKSELFITGILVNDDANATALETFYAKYHMNYFVSNDAENKNVTSKVIEGLKLDANFTLPLTVLYKNGNYYTHYEGPVPVEMIDHDIKTALENK